MSRPAVTYPRTVSVVIDFLTTALAGELLTVGFGLPTAWTLDSAPHVEVAVDGSRVDHPVSITSTVRLVVWSSSPTTAERLALLAAGLLLAYTGAEFSVAPRTGPFPAVDPDHSKAALSSLTVAVRVRSEPIT